MSFPISSQPKVAVIYDESTQTWYPLAAGAVSTSLDYNWIGKNSFADDLRALKGINNFLTIAQRDSTITNPVNGIICYVQTDNNGNRIDQFQYYDNGWKLLKSVQLVTRISDHTLILSDAGKAVLMDSGVPNQLTIPSFSSAPFNRGDIIEIIQIGAGQTTVVTDVGVQVRTNNSEANILMRFRRNFLINLDTDEWLLSGEDPKPPPSLEDLSNVNASNPQNGNIIQYDSSINAWVLGNLEINVGSLSGVVPISQGGTDASTKVGAQRNLGIYIQESQPIAPADGDLWFW
jgi:hypothetical protein